MGMISTLARGSGAITSLGRSVADVSEVFTANATEGQRLRHAARQAALRQLGQEFTLPARSRFDRFVDGLNRLPRPLLAFGTLALFVYAMVAPLGFAARMEGLGYVPDPLWWLLGAIVGFYFGARELHYRRDGGPVRPLPEPVHSAWHAPEPARIEVSDEVTDAQAGAAPNPALRDWQGTTY